MANREITQENQKLTRERNFRDVLVDVLFITAFASFLAYLKPFGMHEVAYSYAWLFWVTICLCGYAIYSPIIYFGCLWLDRLLPQQVNQSNWIKLAISALAASCVMAFIAPLIIRLFFSYGESYWHAILPAFTTSLFIGGALTLIGATKEYLQRQKGVIKAQQLALENHKDTIEQVQSESLTQFLSHLPLEKRGKLYCLEMDDHYLNVHTDKGSHLVLMRFKDALHMLHDYAGLRVHRSWWVAEQAITNVKKEGRKLYVVLDNGIEAPVSKTYAEHVKRFM